MVIDFFKIENLIRTISLLSSTTYIVGIGIGKLQYWYEL